MLNLLISRSFVVHGFFLQHGEIIDLTKTNDGLYLLINLVLVSKGKRDIFKNSNRGMNSKNDIIKIP